MVFGGLGGKVDSCRSWHGLVHSMFTLGMANVTNCAKILREAFGMNKL